MNCRPASAANEVRRLLSRNGAGRSFHAILAAALLSRILLILLAGGISAAAQNSASLTIQGVMPAAQPLSLSSIQTSSGSNRITVTLDAKNNAATGYAITIKSKTSSAGTNGGPPNYQLNCGERSLTLAAGTSKVIADCTRDKSAKTVLQILNAPPRSDDTLTLTVISQ